MLIGSGHEPRYLPELDGSYQSHEPPRKSTVVKVAALGSAVTAIPLFLAFWTGVRFFGDQSPLTAEELMQRNKFLWIALGVVLLTVLVAFATARRIDMSWPGRIGLVVVGVVLGPALCLGVLAVWSG